MDKVVYQYIEKRYPSWLDYSYFHCTQAGIADEAADVLNEVLVFLLNKNEDKLFTLSTTKSNCGRYMEMDMYVLRMIKLNIFSPTSPYQSRYKPIPMDSSVEFSRLKIVDEENEERDYTELTLERMHQVRDAYESLNLSRKARSIFEHRFFHGIPFSHWEGEETKKELYEIYNKVVKLIQSKINGKTLI